VETRFLRLRNRSGASRIIHIGTANPEAGGYRALCRRSIVGNISAELVAQIRGDECARCQAVAKGKEESVGGKPIAGGSDWPGAIRNPRGAKERIPLLPRKQ